MGFSERCAFMIQGCQKCLYFFKHITVPDSFTPVRILVRFATREVALLE